MCDELATGRTTTCTISLPTAVASTSASDTRGPSAVRENSILDVVSDLCAAQSSAHRRELLAANLVTTDDRETREREAERERLQRTLVDLSR
jgi:hypothetical protein